MVDHPARKTVGPNSNPLGVNPRMLRDEPMQRCALSQCKGACCLHGVWIDGAERADILAHTDLIALYLPETLRDPQAWFDGRRDQDPFAPSGEVFHSNVLPDRAHYGGTACVFLRDDHKCALQVAGQTAGLHPWRFKPFYCILHPLDLDDEGRITLDETQALLAEEGSCLRPTADGRRIPLTQTFAEELLYLLGEERFRELQK
jgi:hypothetical protein